MRKIYTGIDIGSDNIKIVVAEVDKNNFYVLASTSIKSKGIKRGLVVNREEAAKSLEEAITDIENQIGVRIDKAIITVPSHGRKLQIVSGNIKLKENTRISGKDINKVLEDAVYGNVDEEDELVTVVPIVFNVDKKDNLFDPKGEEGKELGVKAVIGVAPKRYLYPFMTVFNDCNIEIVDIVFGSIGDYHINANKDTDKTLGAIINIGEETINVSIFNKKIIIKNEIIKLGSKNIDNDISYIYGVSLEKARELKENFAVCSTRYADVNDTIEVQISDNEMVTINQEDITKVVESRIVELLKLSKNQINNLTNRKISYIIVTGGITELTGFGSVVENTLGINASISNDTIMGIRNNKFSSAAGVIKYFDKKMELRDKVYSMFDKNQIDSMMNFDSGNMVPLEENNSSTEE
ncbi:MAG: cell division protein FtsA [Firmicutes bacterium]|nr:cell division protein FtsA [Bacillota bacterium]